MKKINLSIRAKAIVLLMLIQFSYGSYAQSPPAWISSPADNATNVQLLPTITIRTHTAIDSSRVTWQYPNLANSVNQNPVPQTLQVIPRILSDSLADSLHKYLSVPGKYVLVDDTTLKFTPSIPLIPSMEYVAVIKNLWVGSGGITTGPQTYFNASGYVVSFKTIPSVHKLLFSSLPQNGYIKCSDSIKLVFNRKINSLTTPLGNLVKFKKLDSSNIDANSITHHFYSDVTVPIWIGGIDSNTIFVKPGPALENSSLTMTVYTDYLNGDSTTRKEYAVHKKDAFKLNMNISAPAGSDSNRIWGLISIPKGDNYFISGEQVTLSAAENDSVYSFVKWLCPENPAINNSTESVVKFSYGCSELRDIKITAVYKKFDSIEVVVSAPTNGQIKVFNSSLALLGGAGNYKIAPNEQIQLVSIPDSNYEHFGWITNDAPLNSMIGSGSPPIDNTLKIQNKGKYGNLIEVTSDIDPGLPKAKQYCASLSFEWLIDEGCKSVNSLPGFGNVTLETDDPFASIPINIDLTGTCYQIEGIMNNGVPTQFTPPVQVLLSSVPVGRAPNCNSVVVFISRVKCKFDLTTYLNNRKASEIGYKKEVDGSGHLTDVTVKIYHKCGERRELIGYSGYANQQNTSVTNMIYDIRRGIEVAYIELPCGEEIELEAVKDIREEGFNFSHWSYGSPMTKYVRPSPPETPTFSFVLDRDKSAIAIFREEFRLRKIGFYQNNAIPWSGGDVSWYSTKILNALSKAGEMPEDINIYLTAIEMNTYAPVGETPNVQTNWVRYGTEIQYQFNEPVNKSSISETNWWRLYCMDESLRYDIGYSGSQKVIYTPKSQYLTWSNEDKRVTQKLLTTESNPRIGNGAEYGISYMEKFRIRTEGITNLSGEHIWNPGTYYAETEMPGVNLFLHSVRPTATSGDGPLEAYTLYDAGIRDVVSGSSYALD